MELPRSVERFLDGLRTGDWDGMEQHFTPDAVYDAAVPGRRYVLAGPEAIVGDLREEWTGKHPWDVRWSRATVAADRVVLEMEAVGTCPGDDGHPAHEEWIRLVNVFRIVDGRIAEHLYYCPGEYLDHELHPRGAGALAAR